MEANINVGNRSYTLDLNKGLDISIPLRNDKSNVSAWYVDPPKFEPVRGDGFVGSVAEGGSVNFRNISFNPHGHGTHTECIGHITPEVFSVNTHIKEYFFLARLVSITPEVVGDDLVIAKHQIEMIDELDDIQGLIIRTLPNDQNKLKKQYSNTNPAFIDSEAMKIIVDKGIKHLMIDTPSVDKEVDGGALASHNVFWNTIGENRMDCSITEMIYVDSSIKDGNYLVNLQFPPFENDAAPSRPLLFEIA